MSDINKKYPHLSFHINWKISEDSWLLLGQCEAYVKAICNTPILPKYRTSLLQVSLIKGAQATTAIEGNTLTEEDIKKIQEGIDMPPSKRYQQIEIQNIIDAYNVLLKEIIAESKSQTINIGLIKRFHELVGKNLGVHLDAIPGNFRTDNRVVGTYRCPDYQDIDLLMTEFCKWLLKEFHYDRGQEFYLVIIQAIVAHVYLEWIHPFGDGNGRTGRLLEFYILLRGGFPNIASHILSNHYNETRSEYYRQLGNAGKRGDLTEFIQYAVLGLRDGLVKELAMIQENQFIITWQKYIYEKISSKHYKVKEVRTRQRDLILAFPLNKKLRLDEIEILTTEIAKKYARLEERVIRRDLEDLISLELLIKENNLFEANINPIRGLMAIKK